MNLITVPELADLLVRTLNTAFGAPIADHDGGAGRITFAIPATGQLFTLAVEERS